MEAEQWRHSKYSHLEALIAFPVTVETLVAMVPEAHSLFKEISSRIKT